jgi:hypothetical protein
MERRRYESPRAGKRFKLKFGVSSDVQQLLDFGNEVAGIVFYLRQERSLDLSLGVDSQLDFAELVFG